MGYQRFMRETVVSEIEVKLISDNNTRKLVFDLNLGIFVLKIFVSF